MAVGADIQMIGLKEAIRSLNKVEPGLRKQFVQEATAIAQPAILEAQRGYVKVPLSGMERKWQQNGKKIFPFSVARAVSGVKLKVDASREAVALIYITQTNAAAAVFESAGRRNPNSLGDSLGRLRAGTTRVIGPATYRKRNEIEREMQRASQAVIRLVQKELD
jgi:hypothetical protein